MIDCLKPEVKPWSRNVNPWLEESEKVSMAKKSSIWQTIYVVNHKPLFHVQVLETVEFGTHFHCYIVELCSQEVYPAASDLVSYLLYICIPSLVKVIYVQLYPNIVY